MFKQTQCIADRQRGSSGPLINPISASGLESQIRNGSAIKRYRPHFIKNVTYFDEIIIINSLKMNI